MNRLSLAFLVLALAGCQTSHGLMMETMDRGLAYEKDARTAERAKEHARAADLFAKSEVDLVKALEIAERDKVQVFTSFLTAKLSIVALGQGRTLEPEKNQASTWEAASEQYVRSAKYAEEGSFLKMKFNALMGLAHCTRPNRNPEGSWEAAGKLFKMADGLAKEIEYAEGRGKALRHQALCLVQGDVSNLTPEARRLFLRARKLGDEEASDLLATTAGHCTACGGTLPEEAQFCLSCGQKTELNQK